MLCAMSALAVLLHILIGLQLAQATIFVTSPGETTTCQGGESCLVEWLEDGQTPTLSDIGACYVGLYNGNGLLIQQIEPVNVASTRSLQFTPDPTAGPDSSGYYINFTSVDAIGNSPQPYTQYSPFFALEGMSGSFSAPVASDTSTLPVPSSVASAPSNTIASTISIGSNPSASSNLPSVTSSSPATASSVLLSSSVSPPGVTSAVPSPSPAGSSSFSGTATFTTSRALSSISPSSSVVPSSSASASATSAATRVIPTVAVTLALPVALIVGTVFVVML
ncbi:uncharacterized protein PHACADRAFT_253959 [Phanerochaete carnosa HHB-10118-sp]|uniref:Yeast cell wall synthesis Kre9/Knh1-like N-terminal domain-containing protein n=1 Tax=Phanerochaete carnosa (strain HHB-10118-sp) TaxID=650164 RepID=K5X1N7_PHACS|nr:uncharacterized protein PHACADRAFT_253959 [Phanerochaete carnosa HHB-10118-sp]EKM56692.1 hypothetical protein PHACADRAFT_253959 [Phanerochaete carnosa HHB-10118-sp]